MLVLARLVMLCWFVSNGPWLSTAGGGTEIGMADVAGRSTKLCSSCVALTKQSCARTKWVVSIGAGGTVVPAVVGICKPGLSWLQKMNGEEGFDYLFLKWKWDSSKSTWHDTNVLLVLGLKHMYPLWTVMYPRKTHGVLLASSLDFV